jgi:hypothetical protein
MEPSKNESKTGRFAPGNRFGKGRPQGSRNRVTIACEQILDNQAGAITEKAIEMALLGDAQALRLVMERILPPRKDRSVRLRLPSIATANGVSQALDEVLQQVASGNITPAQGSEVAGILEGRRRVLETEELEARVAAIEATARKY